MNLFKLKHKLLEIKFKDRFILPICFIFILGGAANIGLTSFFMSLPFWILFYWRLCNYKKQTKIIVLLVTILTCSPLIPKEDNPLFFPDIGEKIQIDSNWVFKKYSDSKYLSLWKYDPLDNDSYATSTVQINKTIRLEMIKVSVSHPELGTSLWPVFIDKNGVEYTISESSLIEGVKDGSIISHDLIGTTNLQSRWTFYLGLLMGWPLIPIILLSP